MNVTPMKRVEIVVDSLHLPRLLDVLRKAGVPGYTVLSGAEGYGDRGDQHADEVSGVSTNAYVMLAVSPQLLPEITAATKPLLRDYGGICLISDCQWLDH